ncbi:hypothetical protein [Erythrobacter sp. SG61-1L]|uniref:hypothetical protein n=1 Tax=Erythrobacter sp. SG61-1L TaxID=1603897 RepID=UPI0006C8E6CF|nr:hypothetical protein [Erythrobacter sp. SG61-1L]
MTGQLLVFAGSLAGVAFLVLVSRWLGLGRGARIADEAQACDLADNALCGFSAEHVTLAVDGRAALLCDSQGRIMVLVPHGALFVARLLDRTARALRNGTQLTVTGSDPTFPPTILDLGLEAEAWERRINAPEG